VCGILIVMSRPHKSKVLLMPSEEFAAIIARNNSIVEVLLELGYSRCSGGMFALVAERVRKECIPWPHRRKSGNIKGGKPVVELSAILVEHSTYQNRTRLKIRLINSGLMKNECSVCRNAGVWCEKPLMLQLDHINGVSDDHRFNNLRLLCPNCHSQTVTFSGKNNKQLQLVA
jgi:Zn finger protein HypA/HybF involved in hydrogenase expression